MIEKKKNAVPETRMHTTHSNILEPILDFLHTYLQVMTDDWKKTNMQNILILTIIQNS